MENAIEFVWWGGRVVVGFAESFSCPTQLQCLMEDDDDSSEPFEGASI